MAIRKDIIEKVWYELGGGPLTKSGGGWVAGKAWWRDGDDLNVKLNFAEDAWRDHVANRGGGPVGLVMFVKNCSKAEAGQWLEDHDCTEKRDSKQVPAEEFICRGPFGDRPFYRADGKDGKRTFWASPAKAPEGKEWPKPKDLCFIAAAAAPVDKRIIVFAEGIKTAQAIARAGYHSCALMNGSNQPSPELLKWLPGMTPDQTKWLFWPDAPSRNGQTGKLEAKGEGMMRRTIRNAPQEMECFWIAPPPDLPEGGDAADLHDDSEVRATIEKAQAMPGAPTPGGDNISEQWGLSKLFAKADPAKDFLYKNGEWWRWDGSIWQLDMKGVHLLRDIGKLAKDGGAEKVKTALCRGAADFMAADKTFHGQFDAVSHLVNFDDGVYDLRFGKTRDATREDYFATKIPGSRHDLQGKAPVFAGIIDNLCGGNADLERWILDYFATCIIGSVISQSFMLIVGAGGEGKSMLVYAMRKALGGYATAISADALLEPPRAQPNAPKPSLVGLVGKRACFVSELKDKPLDTEIIKALTGDDLIEARALYQQPIVFESQATIIMTSNTRPRVYDTSKGFWRRVLVLDVSGQTPEVPMNQIEMKTKLAMEAPAIRLLLARRATEILRRGEMAEPPESIVKAAAEYRAAVDPIGAWLQWYEPCSADDGMSFPQIQEAFEADTGAEWPERDSAWFGKQAKMRGYPSRRVRYGEHRETWWGLSRIPGAES